MKAKQVVTQAQKDASKKLWKEWRKQGVGQQPFAVIDESGHIVHKDRRAVCLGEFHRKNLYGKVGGSILFQYVITNDLDGGNGNNCSLTSTDSEIEAYLRCVVRSQLVSPYICKHTAQERREMGVPISLVDVPTNAPILTSTYVRFMWDRHNNKHNQNIAIVKELRPEWGWRKVFVAANAFSPLNKQDISPGLISCCHTPFGFASLAAVRDFWNGEFNHEKMDGDSFDLRSPSRGKGIESMMQRYETGGPTFNSYFTTALQPIVKAHKYGGNLLKQDDLSKAMTILAKLLRRKKK